LKRIEETASCAISIHSSSLIVLFDAQRSTVLEQLAELWAVPISAANGERSITCLMESFF